MPAKRKPKAAAKAEAEAESSSDSDSDSDSSSSSSSEAEAAAPKKTSAKGKAKAKGKAEAAKEGSSSSDESSSEEGGDKAEAGEKAKPAFEPPPRPVFTAHDKEGDITGAKEIEYCPHCSLPPDFCMYGPIWDKCKPWCMEKYPHYYPELFGDSLDEAKKKAAEAADKAKVKELPGGKKTRAKSPEISIKKLTRGGRKCVTSIAGLDQFGVKLDDAAKKFKKKFACGVSVVKGDPGFPDTVDIQGPFENEVMELCVTEFSIPAKKISNLEEGTKKKGKGRQY